MKKVIVSCAPFDEHAMLVNRGFVVSDTVLFVWRVVAMVVSLGPLSIVLTLDPRDFVFYLTDWGLLLTCLYFFYVAGFAFLSAIKLLSKKGLQSNAFCSWQLSTFLFEIAWTTEFVIFFCYWLGSLFWTVERTLKAKISSYIIHSVPFALLFVELLITRTRYFKAHYFLFQLLYVPYGFVNWAYLHWHIGSGPVYPNFTWDNWGTVIGVCIAEGTAFFGLLIAYLVAEWKHKRSLQLPRPHGFSQDSTEVGSIQASFLATV
jgi:hypothetical protein